MAYVHLLKQLLSMSTILHFLLSKTCRQFYSKKNTFIFFIPLKYILNIKHNNMVRYKLYTTNN